MREAIKARVVELINEVVVTDDKNAIYYNKENQTFSNGSYGGNEVNIGKFEDLLDQLIDGIPGNIYLYRNRDDGIISIENDYLAKNHPDDTDEDFEQWYEFEIDGLYIGWD